MPGQTKKINPGRAFRLFYSEGEKMTFEQAKYKYNCYARDVLGLVGELEQPDPATSTKELDSSGDWWILRCNQEGVLGFVTKKGVMIC